MLTVSFVTVYNDGTTKTLVNLSGTIPVAYTGNKLIFWPVVVRITHVTPFPTGVPSGKTYNIPVCVWLEESYPRSAPLCYVKPTSEMLIVRSQNVSSNGEVLLPCLDQWRPVSLNHRCSPTPGVSGVTSVSSARVSVTWWACCSWWSPCLKTLHQYVCGPVRSLRRRHVSTDARIKVQSSLTNIQDNMELSALGCWFWIRSFLPPDSGWLQFHRQSEVLSRSDGSLFLSLTADTDELLHQENETSCWCCKCPVKMFWCRCSPLIVLCLFNQ